MFYQIWSALNLNILLLTNFLIGKPWLSAVGPPYPPPVIFRQDCTSLLACFRNCFLLNPLFVALEILDCHPVAWKWNLLYTAKAESQLFNLTNVLILCAKTEPDLQATLHEGAQEISESFWEHYGISERYESVAVFLWVSNLKYAS